MLENLRKWLSQRRSDGFPDVDESQLPMPKTPGDQPLGQTRFIVLDLETSGLNPSKDEVIAIGAVAIRNNAISLSDQFDLILRRPELDITETVLIHGIGPEALTSGHETEDALLHLLDWMNGDPVLAYHSAFDQRFLEKALRQTLGYTRSHTWLDVAELMPSLFPDAETGGRGLDHWADHFRLEVSERHHAAADAMVTAELTLIALNRARTQGIRTVGELADRLKYHRKLQSMHRY